MARIKTAEVIDFLKTGKRQRCGELVMSGDVIFSYDVPIATVERGERTVKLDATVYSKTTSAHQQAVRVGLLMLVQDDTAEPMWRLTLVNEGRKSPRGGAFRGRS